MMRMLNMRESEPEAMVAWVEPCASVDGGGDGGVPQADVELLSDIENRRYLVERLGLDGNLEQNRQGVGREVRPMHYTSTTAISSSEIENMKNSQNTRKKIETI